MCCQLATPRKEFLCRNQWFLVRYWCPFQPILQRRERCLSQAEGGAAAVLLPSYSCSTPTRLSALVSTPPPLLMLQCTRYRRTRLPAASCRRAASRHQAQVRAQGGAVRCERRAGSRCHGGASKGLFASSWRGGAMWSRATQRGRRLLLARIQELLQSRGRVPQCAGGRALRRRWKQGQGRTLRVRQGIGLSSCCPCTSSSARCCKFSAEQIVSSSSSTQRPVICFSVASRVVPRAAEAAEVQLRGRRARCRRRWRRRRHARQLAA